ncbi:hypothetical protein [Nostoc sp. DedQUE07]|uniref:hypothetical protein n=1 Tax=Nostoc sp. DedQUE07 TaxID=3075392 RepID=UPI002AD3E3BC|nr:hypothetical protein [Nostoc sp. DedQUE07]MDZ8131932.1 hypothetical protein [Nostoc sp. DedQUE07]
MKKEKIPSRDNHELGYASNYHLQHLTSAEHISIRPGQEIYCGSMYVEVSGEICTTYKYPYQYKEESSCLYEGTRYIGKKGRHAERIALDINIEITRQKEG